MIADELDAIDVAVVAYRDEGVWYAQELRAEALESVETIARELRRFPGETGALALLAIDEDFVLVVRVQGARVKVLLSDASAATDWEIARSAVDHLGIVVEDDEEQVPAGDLGIVADMGFSARDMGALLDDYDLYPDEILSAVAERLGFGTKYDELAGLSA